MTRLKILVAAALLAVPVGLIGTTLVGPAHAHARAGTSTTYPWGEEGTPGREADGEYLAGPIPVPQRRRRRVDRDVARRLIPPQRFWARRHDRQCLGVDNHAVPTAPPDFGGLHPMLWTELGSGRQPDPQGRLAPLRTAVLPSLPARRAFAAIAGQRDHPYQVPLRRRSQHQSSLATPTMPSPPSSTQAADRTDADRLNLSVLRFALRSDLAERTTPGV